MSSKSDLVEIPVHLLMDKERAWFVDDGKRKVWVPKSLCELEDDDASDDSTMILVLPEWLALEKELI